MAPILGLMITVYVIMQTVISQLILGKFLVTELSTVLEYNRLRDRTKEKNSTPESIFISPERRAKMQDDISDTDKPWGAIAVLAEIDKQCSHVPVSSLALGRSVFVIIPSAVIAFALNDFLNSSTTSQGYEIWPVVAMFLCAVCLVLLTALLSYRRYYVQKRLEERKAAARSDITSANSKRESSGRVSEVELRESSIISSMHMSFPLVDNIPKPQRPDTEESIRDRQVSDDLDAV